MFQPSLPSPTFRYSSPRSCAILTGAKIWVGEAWNPSTQPRWLRRWIHIISNSYFSFRTYLKEQRMFGELVLGWEIYFVHHPAVLLLVLVTKGGAQEWDLPTLLCQSIFIEMLRLKTRENWLWRRVERRQSNLTTKVNHFSSIAIHRCFLIDFIETSWKTVNSLYWTKTKIMFHDIVIKKLRWFIRRKHCQR